MTRTILALAFVLLLQLAAGAGAATVDAEREETAPAPSVPPASTAPDPEAVDRPDERDPASDEPLPGDGDRTGVLIGAALIVAAVVHWRLTAPPPHKD